MSEHLSPSYPVLPLRDIVVFPHMVVPLFVGRDKSVRALEEVTPDGYVFRTDLRLRPDPGSTPVAVSTEMAELYYESVGQNWERMVWIKGRPAAGDRAAE